MCTPDRKFPQVHTNRGTHTQERLRSCDEASAALRGAIGTANTFGDRQLGIDVAAEQCLYAALQGRCAVCSSEESPEERQMGGSDYCVVFDPLDGSSLVEANLAVGTIFGVVKGTELLGARGRNLVAAGYALYGPRTDLVVSTCVDGATLSWSLTP